MYQGNPLLRSAGEKVVMTKEQIDEYIRCKNDILYFAENYFYIISNNAKKLIVLWEFQKKILKAMLNPPDNKRHICLLSSRQIGKSCLSSIFITHYALFNKDGNIAILANKEASAKLVLEKIQTAYQNFPLWLQKGVSTAGWNKESMTLENGIKIFAASSSSESIRGTSNSVIVLDEAAFLPPHIWPAFWNSIYSTISSIDSAKIIMVSTPKGLNHFYEIYSKAVRGENDFYPIKISWQQHPERDEKWAEKTRRDMGDLQAFLQEHCCQFLGSSNTLISPGMLESIQTKNPIDYKYNGSMLIYELPIEGCQYVLGVDPSRGTGSDYAIIQVLKINSEKDIDQVAVFRNNEIDPEIFAGIVVGVSEYYNNAEMMVESNDIGELVCDKIFYEYECDRLINFDKNGLGIRATKKTKLAGVLLLKKYIENGWFQINDMKTLYELSRFEEKTPGSYSAIGQNEHDDTISGCIWGLYYLISGFYDSETNGKDSGKSNKSKYDDNDTPTFLSSEDIHSNFFGNAFSNDFQDTPQNFQNSQNNDIYFGNGYN